MSKVIESSPIQKDNNLIEIKGGYGSTRTDLIPVDCPHHELHHIHICKQQSWDVLALIWSMTVGQRSIIVLSYSICQARIGEQRLPGVRSMFFRLYSSCRGSNS